MERGILAIETSGEMPSVAVFSGNNIVERKFEGGRGKLLLSEIDKLLIESELKASELIGLAVGIGPGSYTGLRIACAAARTLSWTLQIPAQGFCSFEAAALDAPQGQECHLIINAYRRELYHASYIPKSHEVCVVTKPHVIPQESVNDFIPENAIVIGEKKFIPNHAQVIKEECNPLASQILKLTEFSGLDSGSAVEPLYLRIAR